MSVLTTVALHYLCGGQMEYHPPWIDGQKWAEETFADPPFKREGLHSVTLQPCYGSQASLYQVDMYPPNGEPTSEHWRSARVQLRVNSMGFGQTLVPVSWYVGDATDFPTGIVRFQEVCGPRLYQEQHDLPAGVWALAFRRSR